MAQYNTRRRYSNRLAHANHKYIDKKLVNGKWVYYYSTPINQEQKLLRERKAKSNAKALSDSRNPAYEERYQKQAKAKVNAKVNAQNVRKQVAQQQSYEARMKKQLEKEAAQELKEKQAKNAATNAARKEREIKKEEARVKQEKKAALNKKVNDAKKAINKAANDAADYFTGSSAKKKVADAQRDLDNTVKSNTAAAARGDFKQVIEGTKKAAAKRKAVDVALKDYEKTFPGQIEKGSKVVANLLNGVSNKAKDAVENVSDKSKFKKAYAKNKKNPNLKNAMEAAKYNRKIQARKKKKTKK